jgi:hypothetical protein
MYYNVSQKLGVILNIFVFLTTHISKSGLSLPSKYLPKCSLLPICTFTTLRSASMAPQLDHCNSLLIDFLASVLSSLSYTLYTEAKGFQNIT